MHGLMTRTKLVCLSSTIIMMLSACRTRNEETTVSDVSINGYEELLKNPFRDTVLNSMSAIKDEKALRIWLSEFDKDQAPEDMSRKFASKYAQSCFALYYYPIFLKNNNLPVLSEDSQLLLTQKRDRRKCGTYLRTTLINGVAQNTIIKRTSTWDHLATFLHAGSLAMEALYLADQESFAAIQKEYADNTILKAQGDVPNDHAPLLVSWSLFVGSYRAFREYGSPFGVEAPRIALALKRLSLEEKFKTAAYQQSMALLLPSLGYATLRNYSPSVVEALIAVVDGAKGKVSEAPQTLVLAYEQLKAYAPYYASEGKSSVTISKLVLSYLDAAILNYELKARQSVYSARPDEPYHPEFGNESVLLEVLDVTMNHYSYAFSNNVNIEKLKTNLDRLAQLVPKEPKDLIEYINHVKAHF